MNELISEFFYEGIRRIIPGLVVVALYFHKQFIDLFKIHHEFFSLMLSGALIGCSWVIGLVIDQIASILTYYLRPKFLRMLKHWKHWEEVEAKEKGPPLNDNIDESHKREIRREFRFTYAEKSMFLNLTCIFFFAAIRPPEPFSNILISYPRLWCIGSFFVFLVCYGWAVHCWWDFKEKDESTTEQQHKSQCLGS